MSLVLPLPTLRPLFRIDATLGEPIDVGPVPDGRRRIVPLIGGTVSGSALRGVVLSGGSADWQTVHEDGSSTGEIRITLHTENGATVLIDAHATRTGPREVLNRLARGEQVDPSEYTFRASARILTAAPELQALVNGTFIAVGGREPAGVVYEFYAVA